VWNNVWYTNSSTLDWSIDKGVTQRFSEEIGAIRALYPGLKKTAEVGHEVWQGPPKKVQTDKGGVVYVTIRDFWWNETTSNEGRRSPKFVFKVIVEREVYREDDPGLFEKFLRAIFNRPSRAGSVSREKVFSNDLVMTFPEFYPLTAPQINIRDPRFLGADPHEHHILNWEATLCIISGSGDWNANRSNAAMALTVAIDWIAWHTNKFGW